MKYLFVILSCVVTSHGFGQRPISLDDLHAITIKENFSIQLSANSILSSDLEAQRLNAQLKPRINLFADVPDYTKTSSPVIQPDGRIAFQSIRQSNSSVGLSVEQVIPQTGGSLFATSGLQRFDDFSSDITQYNGIPVRLGVFQPLFGFNPWKYDNKINSLNQDIAEEQFDIAIEESFTQVTDLFFEVLIAHADVEIARENQSTNQKLLAIAEERYRLGKISRDELLQLEIARDNAALNYTSAQIRFENAERSMYVISGGSVPQDSHFYNLPTPPNSVTTDMSVLMEHFNEHRPEFKQLLLDNMRLDRASAQAKADFGLQANVSASIGLARGSDRLKDIYSDPFDEQRFNVSLQIPIVDWGRRKTELQLIENTRNRTQVLYDQNINNLEQSVVINARRIEQLLRQIATQELIMAKSQERFSISNQRYVLGDIDITNLTISQQENNQARRNYIQLVRDFWISYYNLRSLTGYDVINNKLISY